LSRRGQTHLHFVIGLKKGIGLVDFMKDPHIFLVVSRLPAKLMQDVVEGSTIP
jgi:hypothetical protein